MSTLLQRAKALADQVLSDAGGFTVAVTFTNPAGTLTKTVRALAVKHNTGIDPRNGLLVNSKTARVTVSEKALTDAAYVTRDATTHEVSLRNHRVTWADASGQSFTYVITDFLPDSTTGNIVCHLGNYSAS